MMPLLGFKEKFAADVDSGSKRQTIRLKRKQPIKVGDKLYLYTGLRTKKCRQLRADKEDHCTWTAKISIVHRTGIGNTPFERMAHRYYISVDGVRLSDQEVKQLAIKDGFTNAFQFLAFFSEHHELPFEGDIIRW